MTLRMKAMLIDQFGGPEFFREDEVEIPEPGAGQILIRSAYASVNPADWKFRAGLAQHLASTTFPLIVGLDAAGIVAKVGAGVTDFKKGDRVVTLSGLGLGCQGTYAEYVCAPAPRVAHLPDHISFAEGATIPIAGASAHCSLISVGQVKKGEMVFINGGAGSVGIFAIQLARMVGARVAATCSTRNVDFVRSVGADYVIDYTRENILDKLQEWAPEGLDLVIDAVGQDSLPRNTTDVIKSGGTLVCVLNLIRDVECFDAAAAAQRGVRILVNVNEARVEDMNYFQVDDFQGVLAAVARGVVRVPPYEVLPLHDVAQAHRRVAEGHVRGKILLKIADL